MKHEILKYLIDHKENADAGFSDFLRKTFPTATRRLVRDSILQLSSDDLIAGPQGALAAVFMPAEDLGKKMADFPGNIVGWWITGAGERQYADDEHRNHERRVNEAVRKASESTTETNASIKLLNDTIIPRFNGFQQLISPPSST